MNVLGVILARAGSKGLPDKCVRKLLGRPMIQYTFDHAAVSRLLTAAVLTTDSEPVKLLAAESGIEVVDRPAELATDTATVDAAARHAVLSWERKHETLADIVVLLYGNVPVRREDLIDRAVEHLIHTGADSVRSVAPATKQHPDWIYRLDGDRMVQLRPNSIYRRQDLDPLYYHDGAVAAVTRKALFGALDTPDDHQAFLGGDRRALVQRPEDAVDVDDPIDLYLAEAVLRSSSCCPTFSEAGARFNGPSRAPTSNKADLPSAPYTTRRAVRPVNIAGRSVGPRERTFVVAEAGVNHNGCVETALRMVDAAADAGADAVKFQMFRAADLVTARAATAGYQQLACGETSQRAMLSRLELSREAFWRIKARCDERAIMFMATPFGQSEVARLLELRVPAIKIASTDLTNVPLLEAVAATDLPIILSTGASTEVEIQDSIKMLRRMGAADRLVLLHCVSCYPAPLEILNLRAISRLEGTSGVPCGLSDHTTSTQVGAWAVAAGACMLEKHFTLDPGASGPDHAMSLSATQLAEYITAVRRAEQALGNGVVGMADREAELRTAARKSVVAAVDIPAGTPLTTDMLTLKRPGTGIPPCDLQRLAGRSCVVDIPSDTTLSWDMIR